MKDMKERSVMKRFFRLVVCLLLIGGWTLSAASLHVVRTPAKVMVFPKDRVNFRDTYVDTRDWTLDSVSQHPAVSARILQRGHADLLSHVVADPSRGDLIAQLTQAIAHPQSAPPATQPAVMQRVAAGVHAAAQTVKSIFN